MGVRCGCMRERCGCAGGFARLPRHEEARVVAARRVGRAPGPTTTPSFAIPEEWASRGTRLPKWTRPCSRIAFGALLGGGETRGIDPSRDQGVRAPGDGVGDGTRPATPVLPPLAAPERDRGRHPRKGECILRARGTRTSSSSSPGSFLLPRARDPRGAAEPRTNADSSTQPDASGSLYIHDLALVGGRLYANAVGLNAVVDLSEPDGFERSGGHGASRRRGSEVRPQLSSAQLDMPRETTSPRGYFAASAASPRAGARDTSTSRSTGAA